MFLIPISELQSRREKMASEMPENSYIYIYSATETKRNSDVDYQFRQDSNFWYFTGINQANCLFVLIKTQFDFKTILFCESKTALSELWSGKKMTDEEIFKLSGVDEVISTNKNFNDLMTEMVKEKRNLDLFSKNQLGYMLVSNLRLIKSEWELDQVRLAVKISLEAHDFAYQNLLKNNAKGREVFEYQFQSDLEYVWKSKGLDWAYYPIVAGEDRGAKYLHYFQNNAKISSDQLVLVDAGCEYNYYASDITRVYSPTGSFSKAQKEIVDLVKLAQTKTIDYLQQMGRDFKIAHSIAVFTLAEGLIALGVLKGSLDTVVEIYNNDKKNKNFTLDKCSLYNLFPHGIGHFLGLDVHDLGSGNYNLLPSMVITVEPGLYFHPENLSIPEKYRGIGVRIEDNVIIREDGAEVIS